MPSNLLPPLANGFSTGSDLTLAIPAGILVIVTIWYWIYWHQTDGDG